MTVAAKTPHTFFDYPMPIPLAHRGGDEAYPENTLAAFKDAYSLGYRYFETDVHYTAGHELVAFHDTDLLRTAGSSGRIADLTADERQNILFNDAFPMPLLTELLEAFPDVYFNIDAKSDAAVEPLISELNKHKAINRVCLASFSSRRLKLLKQLAPKTPVIANRYQLAALRTGLGRKSSLHGESRYLEMPSYALWESKRLPIINRQFVDKMHASSHKVLIWTVNEEDEMNYLLDMGVDGIFTDKPRLLKQVLQKRGQWVDPT